MPLPTFGAVRRKLVFRLKQNRRSKNSQICDAYQCRGASFYAGEHPSVLSSRSTPMKIALAVSALAQSIGFALMLTVGSLAFGQGIVYVSPQQPVYYSGIVPDTLDFPIDINGDGIADFILDDRK